MKNSDNETDLARAIGEVVMEAARVEHAVAELCWTLMGGRTEVDVEMARLMTENMQFRTLKETALKMARLCEQRGLIKSETRKLVKARLDEGKKHMDERGEIAHIVVFGSGGNQMGFRRKGDVRFQELDPVALLELSGRLAQSSAQISILHGEIHRELGVLPHMTL